MVLQILLLYLCHYSIHERTLSRIIRKRDVLECKKQNDLLGENEMFRLRYIVDIDVP